jgi:hypothetical protein
MNWWLAMPTQDYLDEEICADHNRDSIAGLLTQLGSLPRKPPQENTELTTQYQSQSSQRYDKERTRVDDRCPRQTRTLDRSRQTR